MKITQYFSHIFESFTGVNHLLGKRKLDSFQVSAYEGAIRRIKAKRSDIMSINSLYNLNFIVELE